MKKSRRTFTAEFKAKITKAAIKDNEVLVHQIGQLSVNFDKNIVQPH